MAFTADFNNAIDSYFNSCFQRWKTINSSRKVIGVIDANDWPPKQIEFEAVYLLDLGGPPSGPQAASASAPFYTNILQWQWAILGTDLTAGIRGRSRGDRGFKNRTIKTELVEANFPYFCEKLAFDIDQDTGLPISQSLSPQEFIRWSRVEFVRKPPDPTSGIVYGVASVYLSDSPVTVTT